MENTTDQNNPNETSGFMRFLNSSLGRFLLIGFLTLVLLIPLVRVMMLIEERKDRATATKMQMEMEWGGDFTYGGMVMRVPHKNEKKHPWTYFYPETETVKMNIDVNAKKRGIYSFPVFQCKMDIDATFGILPDAAKLDLTKAQVGILVEPNSRIAQMNNIQVEKQLLPVSREDISGEAVSQSFCASTPFTINPTTTKITTKMTCTVNGSGRIMLQNRAKKTSYTMTSNWNTPSFSGILPNPDAVKKDTGFTNHWELLKVDQKATDTRTSVHDSRLEFAGVTFLEEVDHYQLNDRTVKYAILVILLTFVVFYLIELIGKMTIHPVHYLMVGLALVMFYLLLLSFSEQIGFAYSYLLASAGVVLLLAWYAYSVLGSLRFSGTVTIAISLLYSFLYVIVNLETYALIVGSIGLFVVLFAIMNFTRRLKV